MAITEKQINELDEFFKMTELPVTIHLDEGLKVLSVSRMIESHLKVLRNNADKPIMEAFYLRLLRLKEILLIKP